MNIHTPKSQRLMRADTEDSNTNLQRQLEEELKLQAVGNSDSLLKEQPNLSMLEGLSSDDASMAEIAAALDKIHHLVACRSHDQRVDLMCRNNE